MSWRGELADAKDEWFNFSRQSSTCAYSKWKSCWHADGDHCHPGDCDGAKTTNRGDKKWWLSLFIANNQVVIFVDFGIGYQVASSIVVSSFFDIQPTSIFAVDLEADGDDDLVVGFNEASTVTVLSCVGRGRFVPMTLPSGRAPRYVTGGDVDGNGLPDILEVGGFDADDSHLRVIFSNCGGM